MANVLKELNKRVLRKALVDGHIKRIHLFSLVESKSHEPIIGGVGVVAGTWTLELVLV